MANRFPSQPGAQHQQQHQQHQHQQQHQQQHQEQQQQADAPPAPCNPSPSCRPGTLPAHPWHTRALAVPLRRWRWRAVAARAAVLRVLRLRCCRCTRGAPLSNPPCTATAAATATATPAATDIAFAAETNPVIATTSETFPITETTTVTRGPRGFLRQRSNGGTLTMGQGEGHGQGQGQGQGRRRGYTVEVLPREDRGRWEGWGTSVAWWGVAVGDDPQLADALFSLSDSVTLGRGKLPGEQSDSITIGGGTLQGGRSDSVTLGAGRTSASVTAERLAGVQRVPGLGLNIVRYNVGGCGRPADTDTSSAEATRERNSSGAWYKTVEGFWVDRRDRGVDSSAYDWSRDARQRQAVDMALARALACHMAPHEHEVHVAHQEQLHVARQEKVHVELFHNAPMWWMTHENTSFGGILREGSRADLALYAANVAEFAISSLHWPVKSISLMNEPSAGWWLPGHGQEGLNVERPVQQALLDDLARHLDSRPALRGRVRIAGVDENCVAAALRSHCQLRPGTVGQLNVHGYDGGLGPNRCDRSRRALWAALGAPQGADPSRRWRAGEAPGVPGESLGAMQGVHSIGGDTLAVPEQEVGGGRGDRMAVWVSEYGDRDADGTWLARSILQDLSHLRPTAWVYWQAVEALNNDGSPHGWGLINTHFGASPEDPRRGTGTRANGKYWVMAQFTRFVRPGMRVLGTNDDSTLCAYDDKSRVLVCVTVNFGREQWVTVDLSRVKACGGSGLCTCTIIDSSISADKFVRTDIAFEGRSFQYWAKANAMYSLEFFNIQL